jgi:peptidoglycan/xylan/chitin deacetylase (PgdA/CDA1 family)
VSSPGSIVVTIDVEADGGGFEGTPRTFESFRMLPQLLETLREREIPLTAFVEGDILAHRPALIDPLLAANTIMESHAWDHSAVRADAATRLENLDRGLDAYAKRFGTAPVGFRAPRGIISAPEIDRLTAAGVRYDSSVFPCFFPGRFNNFAAPRTPFRHPGSSLTELPVGALSGSRFPMGLSFVQLVGWTAFRALFALSSPPPCFIFNLHLHDLWRGTWHLAPTAPGSLRMGYRASLRGRPFDVLVRFLDMARQLGYRFTTTRAWLAQIDVASLPEYPAPRG